MLFVPVGNPAPDFYGDSRPGANEGTNTAAALDVKTGKLIWARQFVPHDTHDWDLSQTSPVIDTKIEGKPRRLLMVSGKDGRLRAVDRDTSDVLYDLVISKQENADKPAAEQPTHICPGLLGGQEWSSSAYDPDKGLVFSPMVDWCGTVSHQAAAPTHKVGEHFYGGGIVQDPIDQGRGVLAAVDVASGKIKWKFEAPAPMLANVTSTSGGLGDAATVECGRNSSGRRDPSSASAILEACANRVARKILIRREPSRGRLAGRSVDMRRQSWRNRIRPTLPQARGTSPRRRVAVAPASTTSSTSSKAILAPRRQSRQANSTPWFFCSGQISTAFCPAKPERAKSNNALGSERLLAYHTPSPPFPSRSPGSACHGLS